MCGIIGVLGTQNASQECYQGLLLMQHRGQDAAGILSYQNEVNQFQIHKDSGLVDTVFKEEDLKNLHGSLAIGHTRYSTIGHSHAKDSQPLLLNYPFGIGLTHNGNILNVHELKAYLKKEKQRYIISDNDAEILLNFIAEDLIEYCRQESGFHFHFQALEMATNNAFKHLAGGFSVIGNIANHGMFAFRDPQGIRPLILGVRDLTEEEKLTAPNHFEKSYCLASESNTLNYLGYEVVRDIQAGELIYINHQGEIQTSILTQKPHTPCMFEWVYFANPESIIDKKNVYASRIKMGEFLGNKIQKMIDEGLIDPDVIVPIPETSRVSAISLSEVIKRPYRELLIKNRYIQRSFILNSQKRRERAVQLKLNPVVHEMKGKNILLVDDSIVRGTTSTRLIEMVRKAGANKVYFASACPPILKPCFYGIDFPDPKELVATDKTYQEIENALGADRVVYLDQADLKAAIGKESLCTACLDGNYPVDISMAESFNANRVKQEQRYEVHP